MLKIAVAVACLSFMFAPTPPQDVAVAQVDAKEKKVRALLDLTGAGKMGKQIMDQMLAQLGSMPGLPEGFADKFSELAKPQELVDKVVPIYLKHVDEKDLDALLEFFRSDVGSRWLAVQPKIVQESMQAGQEWGRALANKVMAELKK